MLPPLTESEIEKIVKGGVKDMLIPVLTTLPNGQFIEENRCVPCYNEKHQDCRRLGATTFVACTCEDPSHDN